MTETAFTHIPKIFHFIWIYGNNGPLGPPVNCLNSWKRIHPEYTCTVWDKMSIDILVLKHIPTLYGTFQSADKFPWIQSIIAKVVILYLIGGVYVDFDLESCSHISKFIHPTAECVFIKNPRPLWGEAMIKRGIVATVRNHPLWEDVIGVISKQKGPIKSCKSRVASNIINAIEKTVKKHYSRVTLVSNTVIVPYGGIVSVHKKTLAVYRSKQNHHWERWHHRIYRKYSVFCENNPTATRIITYFFMGLVTGVILNIIFMVSKNAINNRRLRSGKLPV